MFLTRRFIGRQWGVHKVVKSRKHGIHVGNTQSKVKAKAKDKKNQNCSNAWFEAVECYIFHERGHYQMDCHASRSVGRNPNDGPNP